MRYADRITFVQPGNEDDRYYYPEISDWVIPEGTQSTRPCHVSDLGLDRSIQLFGNYTKQRRVVRLEQPITDPYVTVIYRGEDYTVQADRLDDRVLYIERTSIP